MTSNIWTEITPFIWVCHWTADVQDPLWDTATVCYSQIVSDLEKKFVILFLKSHACCPSQRMNFEQIKYCPLQLKVPDFIITSIIQSSHTFLHIPLFCFSLVTGSLCPKHFKHLNTFSLSNDLFGLNWTWELLTLCLRNKPAIFLVPRWLKWVAFKQIKVVLELSLNRIPLICEKNKQKKIKPVVSGQHFCCHATGYTLELWASMQTCPTETKCKICMGVNGACSLQG